MRRLLGCLWSAMLLSALLSGEAASASCHPVSSANQNLSNAQVHELITTTAALADRLTSANTTIAVVDRVGNVLGVWRTDELNSYLVTIRSGIAGASGGLEGASVRSEYAAIAKAITGAYLSSSGNAFSTRTASFIVQKNFIPTLRNFPSGPLFGVQFSQLPCGDFVQKSAADTDPPGIGPRRSPLGLSADPGGFPLYKNGKVVGGIGVVVEDRPYTLDLNPINVDSDIEEIIAEGGSRLFAAPACIRAEKITAGGFNLRYSDVLKLPAAPSAAAIAAAPGGYVGADGYFALAAGAPSANHIVNARTGKAYGDPGSGYRLQSADAMLGTEFVSRRGVVLTDLMGTANRFAPTSGSPMGGDELAAGEVEAILQQALGVANQARAQIRKPLNSPAEVTISVVDVDGTILGMVRTPDAPVFGTDVSVQKARTAAFFSRLDALSELEAIQNGSGYAGRARTFFGLAGAATGLGKAVSARAIGNVARPNFPDGIEGKPRGPFSSPTSQWSPFNVGLQLDIVATQVLNSIGSTYSNRCTTDDANVSADIDVGINNGIQIFPGAVPIYRGNDLVGAIGISGDGVDQDDMIAALGLHRAFLALGGVSGTNPGHAPRAMRSDRFSVPGPGTLRYVQCPQSPFVSSQAQNVCNF